MKTAFSLLELIFAIVIIGIIAAVAVPKLVDTKDTALASTIKRDISSTTTAVQNYVFLNKDISKISDAITLPSSNWSVENLKATFKESSKDCIIMEIKDNDEGQKVLSITIDASAGSVCKKLNAKEGISNSEYVLY